MAVYFVYRSHYDNPGAFYLKRFAADTVLDWFRSIWKGVPNEEPDYGASDHAQKLIGRNVYSLGSLFGKIHEESWPPPKTMNALGGRLNDALYVGELKGGAHHIQILTDDDELEMAIYLFDDHYAEQHPDRCAFLMRDDWRLPDGGANGEFKPPRGVPTEKHRLAGEGRTYFAHFASYDSGGLTDLGPDGFTQCGVVRNARVPDVARFLFTPDIQAAREEEGPRSELAQLVGGLHATVKAAKGQEAAFLKAVAANPNDTACWSAYSDWLLENDKPTLLERVLKQYSPDAGCDTSSRDPKKDTVVVQAHVAQASKHVAKWGNENLYHHFIFFDDLWANAHPDLASSILRTANRWDPL
jgi:uncharacterized protein (TIGR02996 family)